MYSEVVVYIIVKKMEAAKAKKDSDEDRELDFPIDDEEDKMVEFPDDDAGEEENAFTNTVPWREVEATCYRDIRRENNQRTCNNHTITEKRWDIYQGMDYKGDRDSAFDQGRKKEEPQSFL